MVKKLMYAVSVAIVLAWPAAASAQELVYVVRHAERADSGVGMTTQADPALSAAGEARAARLAAILKDAGITAIFTTEYIRTKATGAPLAKALGLSEQIVPARDTSRLVAALRARPHDILLVVGHSNTVPDLIKALGGPAVTIGENEYDALFVFVPATGTVSRIRY